MTYKKVGQFFVSRNIKRLQTPLTHLLMRSAGITDCDFDGIVRFRPEAAIDGAVRKCPRFRAYVTLDARTIKLTAG